MLGGWSAKAGVLPHKCAIDNQGSIESGPYFDTGFEFHDPRVGSASGLAPHRLFISHRLFGHMYRAPGCALRAEHEAARQEFLATIAAMEDQVSELTIENERLQEELAAGRDREDDELADRIAVRLAARGAAAPKPRRKAADG